LTSLLDNLRELAHYAAINEAMPGTRLDAALDAPLDLVLARQDDHRCLAAIDKAKRGGTLYRDRFAEGSISERERQEADGHAA